MGPLALSFGAAVLALVYLNLYLATQDTSRFALPALCSGLLLVVWLASNVLKLGFGTAGLDYYPPIDAVAGIAAAVIFALRPRIWSLVVMLCFAAMNVAHAGYAHEGWRHEDFGAPAPDVYRYKLKLNALFVVQLLATALPGGLHVAARVGDWLAGRPVRRHDMGLPRRRTDAGDQGRQGPA